MRSGTLNVPGIAGFGKACSLAAQRMWDDSRHISLLRTTLEQNLLDLGGVSINGNTRQRLPNTSNLSFHGIQASTFIKDLFQIAVATGSACTSALPCHRVIGSDGQLTGYGGGLWRKKWLLDHEEINK